MSSPGVSFNPLAIVAPDLYAKQIGIARRQALGQALLQGGEGDPGKAAFGGLRNAGNSIIGALLLKNADGDMANLYSPQPPTDTGQISNNAGPSQAPAASPQQPMSTGATDEEGSPISAQVLPPTAQQPQQQQGPQSQGAGMGSMQQPGQPRPRTIPEAMAQMVVTIPGMTRQASINFYASDPKGYYAKLADALQPTPNMKDAGAAYGYGTPEYSDAVRGIVNKAGSLSVTRGMVQTPDGRTIYAPTQAPAGYQYVTGQNGQPILIPTENGAAAVAGSNFDQTIGKGAGTPATGWVQQRQPDGSMAWMPQATNQAVMSGNGGQAASLIPGINASAVQAVESGGNPNAVSPVGARGPMQTMPGTLQNPGFGVQPARDNSPQEQARVGNDYLNAMMARYKNPVLAHIANNMGPEATDRWLQSGGDFARLPQETQNYLGRVAVSQAVPQRGAQPINYSQQPQSQGQGNAAPMPELPPGVSAGATSFQNNMSNNAGGEWNQTHAMASDVPTRLNVLQSILQLSQSGAPTGSTEWQNEARHVAAAMEQSLGRPVNATSPAALMGEIQKYMGQYSNRMHQGQGGTGSDKQLDAVQEANPNETMFPATLQRVVPWIMANERGIAAKANFLDSQPGAMNDPHAQIAAQNAWRNMYSPRIAQFEMMNPQQQAGYLSDPRAFKSAADRRAFAAAALKLHPYFQSGS